MKTKFTFFAVFLFTLAAGLCQTEKNRHGYDLIKKASDLSFHNPDSALEYGYKALLIGQQNVDKFLQASAYAEIGNALRTKGNAERSLTYFFKSLSLLHDSEKELSKKASVMGSLGNAYYSLGDFKQATYHYSQAYNLKSSLGNEFEAATVATQLAGIYSINGKPDSSFYFARIAEPILLREHAIPYLANLYNAIGAAYQMTFRLDSALVQFEKATRLFESQNMHIQLQSSYYNLANVNFELKNYNQSISWLNEGFKIFENYPNHSFELLYYELYTRIYEMNGNFAIALEFKKKQDSIQNIIYAAKEEAAFKDMEEKFQLVEQEQAIQQQQAQLQQKDLDLLKGEERFYRLLTFGILTFGILVILSLWFWFRKKTQEQIEKEKERFFSNVMHEIRTPLSLITGPAENLKTELNESDREKNVELIQRNSKRLTNLVNQLLDVSKIDAGKFLLTKKAGNLEVFIREVAENFEVLALQKRIEIKMDQENTNQIIRADFDALEKIISNLVSNAIKYSPSNTVVTLKARLVSNQLELSVSDQGTGISKSDQQEIFSRFMRGKNSGMSSGVGIGLSLVKQLTDLMGGTIGLESKINAGSCFEIKVPVEKSQIASDIRSLSDDSKIILLVEDDPDMQLFVQSVLEKENFQVVCATHGKEALEILNDLMPDLILSDVMMPEMDGISMTTEIRTNDLFAHIPVILISAKHASETKIEGLETGADIYLEKPFNPRELILTVQNFLKTLSKSRERFDAQIKKELSFEEKIHSEDHYIQKLNAEILKELDNADFSVEELADRLSISRSQLHRKVKSLTGKSISIYVRIIRLEKAYELLKQNAGNVTEVAYSTGFNSQSYFTKCFTEHFGKAPSEV